MVGSLYIHVPFCPRKCVYCDFVSVPFDRALSERYLGALLKEIALRADQSAGRPAGTATCEKGIKVKTLFIGGGTPTVLGDGQLKGLLDFLGTNLDFYPDAEVTVEANPATLDGKKAGILLRGGVGRLSIGAQSFDEEELKILGRVHRPADAAEAVLASRAAGFDNIGLDLMYGIPGQTRETWGRTLEAALELGPRHISAYELTVEEKTGLWGLVKKGAIELPPEDEVLAMSGVAEERLGAAGFMRYEVSNYALPGFECRHNLNYWRR
ncbi:MAG: radical SAM family heme chaperone HemW, partial [Nitrospiraceae bacterium]|nr:radical SAM family heme chaperone HemW [Nitrospiraceae bacterium]